MTEVNVSKNHQFDRTNAIFAGLVFLVSFIVYAMTVQRSFSFWDCGEMIASSVILGIPHPPGFPLQLMISRVFAIIPFVEDVSYRVNYVSVVSSALTALFSYLIAVRLIRLFHGDQANELLNRIATYAGGVAGGFFVAFSATNWGNSVEAETYALSLAFSTAIFWLTLIYHERRNQPGASKIMILAMYLAVLGIGVHLTVFLVVPICAIFFILNDRAVPRDYLLICLYALIELFLIVIFSNGRGEPVVFKIVSVVLGMALLVSLYRKIRWGILIAIATTCTLMVSFSLYFKALPIGVFLVLALAIWGSGWRVVGYYIVVIVFARPVAPSQRKERDVQWRTALAILLVGFLGLSVHAFIPIRSAMNPRIDENHPSRNWQTFVDFLDRKQYGQESMVDRMFERRGEWSNQFGRHANMGFWSYFEKQYSSASGGDVERVIGFGLLWALAAWLVRWGWLSYKRFNMGMPFLILCIVVALGVVLYWRFGDDRGLAPFLVLGVLGSMVAIRKRVEIGLPFLTLIILASVGLILYMNFADGTMYDPMREDAYLEVRNRDYFFTPAFVFFGISMGLGVAAVLKYIREALAESSLLRPVVYATSLLGLLPVVSLASNYHPNDRSKNFLPLAYAKGLLDGCAKDAILFTVGDNDTFPVWCLQEAYNYRKDIRVVNLSLLNTDWYVAQMKNQYGVPISLKDEQILWNPYELPGGQMTLRPDEPFADRPRRRMTYMHPQFSGVATQDLMVDEIVIENRWRYPLYFSAPPYAESPLNLRDHALQDGQLYRLERDPGGKLVDVDHSYDLLTNVYSFEGMQNSEIFRDDNASGIFFGVAISFARPVEEMLAQGDTTRAEALMNHLTEVLPEFWQPYTTLSELALARGDTGRSVALYQKLHDTLTAFLQSNPESQYYQQDLGTAKFELGRLTGNAVLKEDGLRLLREGWAIDMNNGMAFRKLVVPLGQLGLNSEVIQVARQYAAYKRNRSDPLLQNILGLSSP